MKHSHIHVAVVDRGVSAATDLVDALTTYGCSVTALASDEALLESVHAENPHVVVLRSDGAPAAALEMARALKRDSETLQTPIILLANDPEGAYQTQALDAGVDGLVFGEFQPIELYARIRSLARLKVMQSELARREEISRQYGRSRVPPSATPAIAEKPSILVAGTVGENGPTLFAEDQSNLSFAGQPQDAIESLYGGGFDAVVVVISEPADAWLTMCSDIRDNTRLFNLPILMIADADSFSDPAVPYEKGASDLLLRPIDKVEFAARLGVLIRQERCRRQLQDAYRRSLHLETGDSLTGLYSYGYLHSYLASLIRDAERWHRELSVGFVDVTDMAGINRRHGYAAGDQLLRQIGGAIGCLVRGEDLTARYGGEEFCIVMPDTPNDVATVALGRVIDVVSQTEYGVGADDGPVLIRLKSGCRAFVTDDTAESLLSRARAAMI